MALEPLQIRFESAGGHDYRAPANDFSRVAVSQAHAFEALIIFDQQIFDEGVVADGDSHALRGVVVGVQQSLAAAQEPAVGASKVKSAREWLLPVDAVTAHPFGQLARFADREFGEIEVGRTAGYTDEIFEQFFIEVGARKVGVRGGVGAANISRVARVSAAHVFGRALE